MNKYFKADISSTLLKYYIFTFYIFHLFNTKTICIVTYSRAKSKDGYLRHIFNFVLSSTDLLVAVYFYDSL